MLQQFKSLIDNLTTVNFAEIQDNAIQQNEDALVQYQVEQWAAGKDANNEPILLNGRGYATSTIFRKRLFGSGLSAVIDRITLFQSGTLYKETFAKMEGQRVTFSSSVSYFPELMQRAGDVTGINESNRIDFAFSFVLPFVSKELLDKTRLRIRVGSAVSV